MLRITQSQSVEAARSYYTSGFSRESYYSGDREIIGRWGGLGAERLGLQGQVTRDAFDALCNNIDPMTGGSLTPRTRSERRPGSDFNFHCPKSVSLVQALTGDELIVEAFRASVLETMQALEADVMSRVRKGARDEDRRTGNLIFGEFIHFNARPVEGVSDPHLHAHCFAFNATHDGVEGRWKAAQFGTIVHDAPYYEAIFHAKFTARLAGLGYGIERNETGWELAGIPQSVCEKFSRRSHLIDELAEAKGITDPKDKAKLGAATREGKQTALDGDAMRREWDARLTRSERAAILGALGTKASSPALSAVQAMDHAVAHEYERASVLAERRLMATALKVGVGGVRLEEIAREVARAGMITKELAGERLTTTKDVLEEERKFLAFARDGRGSCRPLGTRDYQFRQDFLSDEQKGVVRHVLESRDRVMILRGGAGTGKTTALQEIRLALEAEGREIVALAPSAGASRGVLREAGFGEAETVARLLADPKLQARIGGEMLLIDEASLLGSKQIGQIFELARKHGARVLLSGDLKQHGSVERGSVLRLLEAQAGIEPATLTEIRRQKEAGYKLAVAAIAKGDHAGGFDRLDAMGWVRQIAGAGRYQVLADDYVRSVEANQRTLVVSPTHLEGDRVTGAIRSQMKAKGRLGAEERLFAIDANLTRTEAERADPAMYNRPGDVVRFHKAAPGFKAGERAVILGRDSGGVRVQLASGEIVGLPLDKAARFQVYRPREVALAEGDRIRITGNGKSADGHRVDNGNLYTVGGFTKSGDITLAENGWVIPRDYRHLAHGYVVTSHASQGKSVDAVLIAQGSESRAASDAKQWYVSVSRGMHRATVYTDDKAALRAAIRSSPEPMAATELVRQTEREQPTLRERLGRQAERINRLAEQARAYASQTLEGWRGRLSTAANRREPTQEGGFAHGR